MQIQETPTRPGSSKKPHMAIAKTLKGTARIPRLGDRSAGIRSYQSHIKSDPWLGIMFAICFVVPTLMGTLYYGLIASDRFVTEAQFAVRPAVGTADKATPDMVGTNAGVTTPLLAQDSLITLEYIHSRPMLEAIESQLPILTWFSRDDIDYFSRLDPSKPTERVLRYWKKRVSIDIESSTGVMSLSVEAFDAAESLAITQAVMSEAERMLNSLSLNARQDAVSDSVQELKLADERVSKLSSALTDLRNREGVLSAQKSSEANLALAGQLRASRINLAVQLAIGQRDLGPEARRIVDIKQQIRDLDDNIARIERESTSRDPEQKRILSGALTQFETLENARKNAEKYREDVRKAYERARILAARKVEFLSPVVQPVKAESSTEPRRAMMMSLVSAGAAVFFAISAFVRKTIIS
ncbi:capsule biosynthesis protein [Methylobacterium sp. WL18]|uniref:capsule biosynthesis protein n=1 Tax=Methylobacterium sp. WL18 TaxID=2603897 RepID=UPI0032B17B87